MKMQLVVLGGMIGTLFSAPVHASASATAPISFNLAASSPDGDFFVANSTITDFDAGTYSYALSRLITTRTSLAGAYTATCTALVPAQARINDATARSKKSPTDVLAVISANPLYGTALGALAAWKGYPVAAYADTSGAVTGVALVQDTKTGGALLTNVKPFGDATGVATKSISQLTTGTLVWMSPGDQTQPVFYPLIFACVSSGSTTQFDGSPGTGLAVGQVLVDAYNKPSYGIVPLDATGSNRVPTAAPITNALISIDDAGQISSAGCLCWSEYFKTVYVGLNTTDAGVAVVSAQLMLPSTSVNNKAGVLRDLQLKTAPIIAPNSWSSGDYVVAATDNSIAINQLGVMNTSTGMAMLVVSRSDDIAQGVFALPLTSTGALANITALSSVASINAAAATEANSTQLVTAAEPPAYALVGAGVPPAAVTDLQVQGDSVFVACGGRSDALRGVFVSQAQFSANGVIMSWSPWAPVAAQGAGVYAFARDLQARFTMLMADGGGEYTMLGQQIWGSNEGNGLWGGTTTTGLVGQVNSFFSSGAGGVQAIFPVQGASGDAWYQMSPQIADDTTLLIFTGRNSCALAFSQVDGTLVQGDQFADASYFKSFDLAQYDLSLGMVTAAAVGSSDSFLSSDGWLFVGGTNGLAVLCTTAGHGWGGLSGGLSDLTTLDTSFSFYELKKSDGSSFSQVRCLLTDANYVYVFCTDGVYRIAYESDAFKPSPSVSLNPELIASPGVLLGSSNETILSGAMIGGYLVLATTSGLWVNVSSLDDTAENLNAIATGSTTGWAQIPVTAGGSDSFGVCAQLLFVPNATQGQGGTLYVLAADAGLNVATVYRVACTTGTYAAHVNRATQWSATQHTFMNTTRSYFTMLGSLREGVYTDGGMMIDCSSTHHRFLADGAEVLRVLPVRPPIGNLDAWIFALQPMLNQSLVINTLSSITGDPATGTLMVPSNAGLQLLQ